MGQVNNSQSRNKRFKSKLAGLKSGSFKSLHQCAKDDGFSTDNNESSYMASNNNSFELATSSAKSKQETILYKSSVPNIANINMLDFSKFKDNKATLNSHSSAAKSKTKSYEGKADTESDENQSSRPRVKVGSLFSNSGSLWDSATSSTKRVNETKMQESSLVPEDIAQSGSNNFTSESADLERADLEGFTTERALDDFQISSGEESDDEYVQFLAAKRLPIMYVLGLLAQLQPFAFHVFDAEGHYLDKFTREQPDKWNVLKTDPELRDSLIKGVIEQKVTLFTDEYPVLFGGVMLEDNLLLIVGPIVIREADSNFLKLYASLHRASNVVLRVSTPAKMGALLLLIHSSLTGEKIPLTSFLDRYMFNHKDIMQQTSENVAEIYYQEINHLQPHNPVSFEHDIIKSIQYGDLESLERTLNSPYAAMRGILAKDALRSQKNLAIVDITLASRALTDIGFPSEDVFIFSDAAIRNVESCRDVEETKALARAFAVQCANKVQERNINSVQVGTSHMVQQACEYMDRRVYDKFDVHGLAQELRVSRGYLSKLFKQEMNMTMSDYMRRKKIAIASILLANTDHQIDDIAISLAFCSRSHFGRVFLQERGCSPAQYRKMSKYPKRLHQEGITLPAFTDAKDIIDSKDKM